MYTVDDFNTKNDIEKEVVQYVVDNVDCFEPRYQRALEIMGRNRCPLSMADYPLFSDIRSAFVDWALDTNLSDEELDEFDFEEVFG